MKGCHAEGRVREIGGGEPGLGWWGLRGMEGELMMVMMLGILSRERFRCWVVMTSVYPFVEAGGGYAYVLVGSLWRVLLRSRFEMERLGWPLLAASWISFA